MVPKQQRDHCSLASPEVASCRCARKLGLRVKGSGFRVQGLGFRVQGSEFRVQGLGFRG